MKQPDQDIPIAIALSYQEENDAPKVIANARGGLAEKILTLAKENDITINKNPEIAMAMSGIPIGEEIPEELFDVMAIILSEIYSTKNQ